MTLKSWSVKKPIGDGKPRKQAIAIALSQAGKKRGRKAKKAVS